MLEFGNIFLLFISLILLIVVIKQSNKISKLSFTCKDYETLLNSINLPIFYKDKDNKFSGCNKTFDIAFGNHKKNALKELEDFKTSQIKELDLTYDNEISKPTIVNFTNYLDGAIGILFDASEMKHNKIKLLKQKNLLESALKGSDEGYWEWDVKTDEIFFSKRTKELLGYKEHEKAPSKLLDWMNLVESYDIAKTNEALASYINGHSSRIDIDHRLRTSLDEIWVNVRGQGTYDRDNNIATVYGTMRDISKQKQELMQIKKEKDLFTTFMDNLPALSFIKTKDGKYIYVNSFYQKLLGFKKWKDKTAEEIFEKNISDAIKESDREAFYEGKHQHEELLPNEEGVQKTFKTYKFPIDNDKTKVLCGFGLDITQEKIYQEKVNLYAKVFDTSSEGMIVTDKNNKIISVNKAFQSITGFSEKEVLGKDPNIRKSTQTSKKTFEYMWSELLSKGSWSGEIFNKNKDGTILPELININVVKNEQNKITNFVCIFQSIEKQKQIESRLKKMAHYDVLTNLPNRTLFDDRLNQAMQRADREKSILGLMFVDLDDFKIINDTRGHHVGDEVLTEVARRLTHAVRDSDTVARLGGDEFVVILEKISQISDISYVADKIISEILKPIVTKDGEDCSVGASLGISIYPKNTTNKKELLEFADSAMYEAKHSGKHCYKFYN